MQPLMSSAACFLVLAATTCTAIVQEREQMKALRPVLEAKEGSVVRAFEFDQRLLVCNAYPSKSPIIITKNNKAQLGGLAFGQCRYMNSRMLEHDKLDLLVRDVEVHGTFEIGGLPQSDAVLLLVLERRAKSPLIQFQSFAFSTSADRKEPQVAVINAFEGNSSMAHLLVEDHVVPEKGQPVASKRSEQLNFNRVYSMEEGTYDASVLEGQLEQPGKKVIRLSKNQNYVIIRMGDQGHFPKSLMVFPEEPSRGGSRAAVCARYFAILAVLSVL